MTSRIYLKNIQEYGYKTRPMLGLSESQVVLGDDGVQYGYAGQELTHELIDPVTGKGGDEQSYSLPLDFRTVGIQVLTASGVPVETQGVMFNNFIKNYSRSQRMAFVQQYDSIDKNDASAVNAFVVSMLQMLTV